MATRLKELSDSVLISRGLVRSAGVKAMALQAEIAVGHYNAA